MDELKMVAIVKRATNEITSYLSFDEYSFRPQRGIGTWDEVMLVVTLPDRLPPLQDGFIYALV